MARLAESGALLVSLEIDEPPELVVDGVVFTRKIEHHLTVFGSRRGKLLLAAAAVDPSLFGRVDALARSHAWNVSLLERFLVATELEAGVVLETVLVLASARVAEFFAEVSALVAGAEDEPRRALASSLASPPPPHVTLYTSDPEGRRAIGFDTLADLDAALANDGAISARWIAASAVPPPRRVGYLP